MGIIKSFVDSFFVFWASFIMIMLALDIRAIVFKELPPLINYYYVGDLIIKSPYYIFFKLDFKYEYITGFLVLITASIMLGILTRSGLDVLWDALIYTTMLLLFSISIDRIVVSSIQEQRSLNEIISQIPNLQIKVIGGLMTLLFVFAFVLLGRSYAKEKEPEMVKEIEL